MNRYDVAVIGMGIVGASAVYALARAGARVVALEAGRAGEGTSSASFAWTNSVHKEPEVYHRLNAAGMAMHRQVARDLGDDSGYHEAGSLEWAEDAEAERELRARIARLTQHGYPVTWIAADRARHMEPGLSIPPHVGEVAFYSGDGWLDAPRSIERQLAAAVKAGTTVRETTPVRSLRWRDDRVEAVVVDGGEILADHVLSCVGPATRAFLAPLGVPVPVDRVPGLLAVTAPVSKQLGRVVHAPGVHLRPDVTGGLLLGDTRLDRLVTDATPPAAALAVAAPLLERAARVFPEPRDLRLIGTRIGVRPMPADGHTIAGRLPGFTNAWVLATHSGVTLGPLLGHLIAGEIVSGAPNPVLAPFRPERFPAPGAR